MHHTSELFDTATKLSTQASAAWLVCHGMPEHTCLDWPIEQLVTLHPFAYPTHCAASFWMVPFVTFHFVQCLHTCMVRIVFLIICVTLDYLIDSKHTEFNYI